MPLLVLLPFAVAVYPQAQEPSETAPTASAPARPVLQSGPWRAWLDSPGGELPFELELRTEEGQLHALVLNGPDRRH